MFPLGGGNKAFNEAAWPLGQLNKRLFNTADVSPPASPPYCLPQGGTPPPARFFIMALRGNVFVALGDVCDLGNMDKCRGGWRETEKVSEIHTHIYIYI